MQRTAKETGQSAETEMRYLEASIRRMTAAVRRAYANSSESVEPGEPGDGYGWWVLACGEAFGEGGLRERDALRDRLRAEVEGVGIMLPEHLWVWDEDNCVQLVITTLPTQDRAERVAQRLRAKGLKMRVVRERF